MEHDKGAAIKRSAPHRFLCSNRRAFHEDGGYFFLFCKKINDADKYKLELK